MTLFRKCYLPRGIKREFNGSRDDGDSAKDSSDSIEFNVLRVLYGRGSLSPVRMATMLGYDLNQICSTVTSLASRNLIAVLRTDDQDPDPSLTTYRAVL